jgi:hypothetical protein
VCVALFRICCSSFYLILLLNNFCLLCHSEHSLRFFVLETCPYYHILLFCNFFKFSNLFFFFFFWISFYKRCWCRIRVPVNADTCWKYALFFVLFSALIDIKFKCNLLLCAIVLTLILSQDSESEVCANTVFISLRFWHFSVEEW